MKKWIILLLAVCFVWTLAGCNNENAEDVTTQPTTVPVTEPVIPAFQVGISLPDRTGPWESRAKDLTSLLQKQDCGVDVRYAEGSAEEQTRQVQKLVQSGVDLLIVASVDAHTLQQELEGAAAKGIKVIMLDRQVLHAQGVSAAVTFDYVNLGVAVGYQIAEAKQLESARSEQRSYTIEFLMGSAEDQNAVLLHQGVMAVLQPYLDTGVLVSKTGRLSLEDTYVQGWKADSAQSKFAQYLESYQDSVPDIVCTVSDELAAGCIAALEALESPVENWPMITGIGGRQSAIRYIMDGKQCSTIYQDEGKLQALCGEIAECLLKETELPERAVGAEMPTYLCPVVQVSGLKGVEGLLDYGLSMRQLGLTEADMDRIEQADAPPETTEPPTEPTQPETTVPPETTSPTQPEPTETKPA